MANCFFQHNTPTPTMYRKPDRGGGICKKRRELLHTLTQPKHTLSLPHSTHSTLTLCSGITPIACSTIDSWGLLFDRPKFHAFSLSLACWTCGHTFIVDQSSLGCVHVLYYTIHMICIRYASSWFVDVWAWALFNFFAFVVKFATQSTRPYKPDVASVLSYIETRYFVYVFLNMTPMSYRNQTSATRKRGRVVHYMV